jgi:hypothetical protein
MSDKTMTIISPSGVIINTKNYKIAQGFYDEGAIVQYQDSGEGVFASYPSGDPKPVFPVWLSEHEKDQIVAHWEKTGMFSSIVRKIRSAESTKGIR